MTEKASSDTVTVQPEWLREMIARDLEKVKSESGASTSDKPQAATAEPATKDA